MLWLEAVHAEDRGRLLEKWQAAQATGSVFQAEYRLRRADGQYRYVTAKGIPTFDQNGRIQEWTGCCVDVHERYEAEARLRESEANLRRLFDSIGVLILICDREGRILHANRTVEAKLGFSREELRKLNLLDLHPPEARTEAIQIVADMIHGRRQDCPLPLMTKSGQLLPVATNAWFGKWDGVDCLFGVSRDLSEENEARERFERLFQSNPAPLAISAIPGQQFQDVNEAFLQTLQYSRAEIIGKTARELELFPNAAEHAAVAAQLHQNARIRGVELKVRRKDGTLLDGLFSGEIILNQGKRHFLTVMLDITERKEMERRLQAKQEMLNSLIEATRVGTWRWQVTTGVVEVNARWAEMVGYSLEELAPFSIETWMRLAHPEDLQESQRRLEEHFTGASDYYDTDCRMRHKNGEWIWVHDRGRVCEWTPEGKPLWMFGTHTDITERKRVQAAIQESVGLLEGTLESTADGIMVADARGKIVRFNSKFSEMWRLPPELAASGDDAAALAFVLAQLKFPDQFLAKVQELYHQPTAISHDVLEFKDGRIFERYSQPQLLRDSVVGRVWSFRDITQQKQAEADLVRQAGIINSLLDAIPDLIFFKDLNGVYQGSNPAFSEFVGRPAKEILGKTDYDLFAREVAEFFREQDRRMLESGKSRSNEEWIDYPDGRRKLIETLKTPYRGQDGAVSGILGISRDITQRQQSEAKLRQAQKMEGIGHLAGGMAHEFNNILAAMMMSLDMVKRTVEDTEAQEFVQEIHSLSRRAADLIKQLLAFSRQSVIQPCPIDLGALVERQSKLLSRLLGERIQLEFRRAPESLWVHADRSAIEQTLMNLCLNARDAMRDGGRLRLVVSEAEITADTAVQSTGVKPGNYVCLVVADTGCGMSDEVLRRLFEPFFTTKDVVQGAGLGLATVKGIIEQHHGWVEVDSAVGTGSTFRVFLPRVAPPNLQPEPRIALPPRSGPRTILLVEDEGFVRRPTKIMLMHHGYEVLEAANAAQALAIWATEKSRINLLFTDMVMPGEQTGLQLAEKLLQEKPGLKVILTSGYNTEQGHLERGAQGAFIYLPKPCDPSMVMHVIQECLGQT